MTFRLADSLPREALARMERELKALPLHRRSAERRKRIEAYIDAGHGSCVLRRSEAADLVQNTLLHFDAQRYRLLAWVVMPNHVHVLFQPVNGWTMASIVASWKSYTGRRLSRPLSPSRESRVARPIWHREYWDRYIRGERHLEATRRYIHDNPVKAGLVERPEDWAWSSATWARLRSGEAAG